MIGDDLGILVENLVLQCKKKWGEKKEAKKYFRVIKYLLIPLIRIRKIRYIPFPPNQYNYKA